VGGGAQLLVQTCPLRDTAATNATNDWTRRKYTRCSGEMCLWPTTRATRSYPFVRVDEAPECAYADHDAYLAHRRGYARRFVTHENW